MKKTLIYISLVMLAGTIVLYSCKKDQQTQTSTDADTQTAQDNSLAEGTFNDVNNMAAQAVESGSLSTYRFSDDHESLLSGCATVTVTPNSPGPGGTILVDFHSTPCYCADHRYRKGAINIAYTGAYRDSGTVITVTFSNYYVGRDLTNLYKVMGTKIVTNRGHNSSGHLNFDINVNGSLLNTANQTMTWLSTRNREWIAGDTTATWYDDQYMISGTASGTGFNGTSYSVTITQPLHVALNCAWIEDGKFDLSITGKATRYFDFGSGACDANATVTINGLTYPFVML